MSVFVHMTLSLRSVAFMTNTEQQSCRNLQKAMYILYISDKAKKDIKRGKNASILRPLRFSPFATRDHSLRKQYQNSSSIKRLKNNGREPTEFGSFEDTKDQLERSGKLIKSYAIIKYNIILIIPFFLFFFSVF